MNKAKEIVRRLILEEAIAIKMEILEEARKKTKSQKKAAQKSRAQASQRTELDNLRRKNREKDQTIADLQRKNKELDTEIEKLSGEVEKLGGDAAELTKRKELETTLGEKDSKKLNDALSTLEQYSDGDDMLKGEVPSALKTIGKVWKKLSPEQKTEVKTSYDKAKEKYDAPKKDGKKQKVKKPSKEDTFKTKATKFIQKYSQELGEDGDKEYVEKHVQTFKKVINAIEDPMGKYSDDEEMQTAAKEALNAYKEYKQAKEKEAKQQATAAASQPKQYTKSQIDKMKADAKKIRDALEGSDTPQSMRKNLEDQASKYEKIVADWESKQGASNV